MTFSKTLIFTEFINMIISIVLGVLLLASISFNFYLFLKKPKKPESLELREFLADMFAGPALLAIARVNPDNILLRSPKNQK